MMRQLMRQCGLQLISSLLLLVFLSGCGLPLPPQNASRDPCLKEGPCPGDPPKCESEAILRIMNALRCDVKDGNCYAAVHLGEAYLKGSIDGYEIRKDPARALSWYKRAAEAGITVAMVQVGNFYRDGICMDACPQEAKCWYERAANKNDVTAMLALAEMYRAGTGIPRDEKQAHCWYEKAMRYGSSEAELQIGLLLMKCPKPNFCQGLDMVVKAAEQGNPDAVAALGDIYYEGRFGRRNVNTAIEYYSRAGTMGSGEAAFKLGMIYAMGQCVERNHNVAAKWIMMAAERSYPAAEYYLGNLYRDGIGVPKNYHFAVVWYNKAIEHGVIAANVALADLFMTGKGVPRILEEAALLYQHASDRNGDPYADLMLSVMYKEGRGVPFCMEKSVFYYQRAKSKPTFLLAEYKIARNYHLGRGLKYNMVEALRWYLLAAEKGLIIAALEIADLFYSGEGECVQMDRKLAFSWYLKAAKQGNPYAQYMVGIMLLEKPCCAEEASVWLHKAAYQGEKPAQYQLGLMYLEGIGVPISNVQAYAWFHTALFCVEDAPPLLIVETVNRMNPDTRIKAVELARKYQSKYTARVQYPTR